mmetsp:Transcript_104145/g.316149  ORF Transcript_104145/g.316149 Transcript_104145/m.316149 type:complete len:339 (+) Transcript_104145:817-1833(+)
MSFATSRPMLLLWTRRSVTARSVSFCRLRPSSRATSSCSRRWRIGWRLELVPFRRSVSSCAWSRISFNVLPSSPNSLSTLSKRRSLPLCRCSLSCSKVSKVWWKLSMNSLVSWSSCDVAWCAPSNSLRSAANWSTNGPNLVARSRSVLDRPSRNFETELRVPLRPCCRLATAPSAAPNRTSELARSALIRAQSASSWAFSELQASSPACVVPACLVVCFRLDWRLTRSAACSSSCAEFAFPRLPASARSASSLLKLLWSSSTWSANGRRMLAKWAWMKVVIVPSPSPFCSEISMPRWLPLAPSAWPPMASGPPGSTIAERPPDPEEAISKHRPEAPTT